MKSVFSFLVLQLMLVCFGCSRPSEKIIGIKIYEYARNFDTLVYKWKNMGINTAFVSSELAADTEFRQVLKKNKIRLFIIFPVFYDPAALRNDTTLYAVTDKSKIARDDWVEFVCPSRAAFRAKKVEEAMDLVKRLEPEGLSIDFIRQFVFWEMIYPDRNATSIDLACFCDSCTENFCKLNGFKLPETCVTTANKASYILKCCQYSWNDYRCNLITSMVQDIADKVRSIQPAIKINVHVVPWRDADFDGGNIRVAAQDLRKIAPSVDYISPMCYSQMLRRDAGWIESVVTEMDKKARGKILPSIQVYPYYIDDTFTAGDFRECTDAAMRAPSRGVIFFSWPLFEKDSIRMDISLRGQS